MSEEQKQPQKEQPPALRQGNGAPSVAAAVAAELQPWRIRALNALLIAVCVAVTPRIVKSVIEAVTDPRWWPQTIPFVVVYLLLVALAIFYRLDFRLRAGGLLLIGYGFALLTMGMFGLVGNGPLTLMALPILSLLLIGARSGMAMTGLSVLTFAAFTLLARMGWLENWLVVKQNPATANEWIGAGLTFSGLLIMLMVLQWFFSRAQIQALVQARKTATELEAAHNLLQTRAEELDRYARLMETAADIARDTTSLLDRTLLLQHTANQIARRLGLDRAAVYLSGKETGEITLAAAGGRQAAAEPDAELPTGVVRLFQEWAPQTVVLEEGETARYELTLPLHVGGDVIGALDIQLSRPTPFNQQEVAALQGMADQLAVALENARLFSEAQESLRELDALYRHYTAEAWQQFVYEQPKPVQLWQGADQVPSQAWQALIEQARSSGMAATAFNPEAGRHLLAVPVKLRDLPIGVLGFHRSAEAGPWSSEQIASIEAVADRLALATDNLRLLDETQRRAARERRVREIADKMRSAADMDALIKIAIQETATMLGAARAFVQLSPIAGPQAEPGSSQQALNSKGSNGTERQ